MSAYTPLQSITLTANAASVTFYNIDQSYTDLIIAVNNVDNNGDGNIALTFNGDTAGTTYSGLYMYGNGSTATSGKVTGTANAPVGRSGTSTSPGSSVIHINNYSNTYGYKTVLSRGNNANSMAIAWVNTWRNTAAVNSIQLAAGTTFAAGSTFHLYGLGAANAKTTKASGGANIYYDNSYVYHVFTGTGSFTPNVNLSADVLVVGGGGSPSGGGGGAGGVVYFASQSLSVGTSYTCTVGAGGYGGGATNSQFGALTAALGGGTGGGYNETVPGGSGGSGGGGGVKWNTAAVSNAGGSSTQTGTGATSYYGNSGGSGYARTTGVSDVYGGGGGGAGGSGGNASNGTGGTGGIGISGATLSIINGVGAASLGNVGHYSSPNYYLAGGGGGGSNNSTGTTASAPAGGLGGGGNGSYGTNSSIGGTPGFTNTGGGGGGQGGPGGSGVIIVRYAR